MSLDIANLVFMELSRVDTVAVIAPNKEEIVAGSPFVKTQTPEGWNLLLKTEDKQNTWKVTQCAKAESLLDLNEKHKELATLALKGYNAAGLYVSVGSPCLFENKRNSHEALLNILKEAIQFSVDPIHIEYVYLCVTDDSCFDCRKDKWRSVSSALGGGVDTFMKGVSNVDDIWKKIRTGSKLPFVLKIALHNTRTKSRGNLFIIDLLHPNFFAQNSSSIRKSLIGLRDVVDTITMPNHRGRLPLKQYLLVDILTEFVLGRSKLTVFSYLNEYPQKDSTEAVAILDLIEHLKGIQCILIPNEDNLRKKRETEDLKKANEQLKKDLDFYQNKHNIVLERHNLKTKAFEQLTELKRMQAYQKELLRKTEKIRSETDMQKIKAQLVTNRLSANIDKMHQKDTERVNENLLSELKQDMYNQKQTINEFEVENKRLKKEVKTYKENAEKYKESAEKHKKEAQRLRKAAVQSQEEIKMFHSEFEAEKQALIMSFREKAREFKEEIRKRFREEENDEN